MKPNLTTIKSTRRGEEVRTAYSRPAFPKTDYQYAGALTLGALPGRRRRAELHSFLRISENYFQEEARPEFAREVAFFGAIVAITALPLFTTVYALAHLF